jgi:diguanylate cyclase (GGDEF)-like protein
MGCFQLDAFQPGALFTLTVVIGVCLVTYWVHRQDSFPGKQFFLLAHLGMVIWLVAALAEIQSMTLECKVSWAMRAWTGIAFVPTAWAIFLLHYALGVQKRKVWAEIGALVAGPLVISAMAWTNPLHQLFYGPGTRLEVIEGTAAVVYEHGPLFHASAIYLYLFMLFSTVVVVAGAFRASKVYRPYFLLLTFVNCVPLAVNLSYIVLGFTIFGFDPTPFAFSVVLFLFTVMIFTNRLFDVNTVARDLLFFNAQSPVLVIDGNGNVIGLNQAAQTLFPECRTGTPLANLAEIGTGLLPGKGISTGDIPETLSVRGRYMSVQITPIVQALATRGSSTGMVMMLSDMTHIAQKNSALEEALSLKAQRLKEIEELRDDLERQVMIDPLTGLNNRRGLYETFANFKTLSLEHGMVVALLDIDHFKSINDRFGHAAGDRVLRDFARALRVHVKAGLPVFRVGGEEFLIMFPNFSLDEIEVFIEAFRSSLIDGQFVRVNDPERIGFSAGLAQWPQDGAGLDVLVKTADERLYQAKIAGRGRTVSRDASIRLVSR